MGSKTARGIATLLGMPQGTAQNKLRKNLLYKYVRLVGHHYCFKCGLEIEVVDDLSIEHKLPWYSGQDANLFWDLDNIAFSHLRCNLPHRYENGKEKERRIGPEGTAWCYECQKFVPDYLFTKSTLRWNGLNGRCKPCNNQYRKNLRRDS